MLERLDVPDHLHRNAREILEIGVEETGNALIELAIQRVGLVSLEHTDVLDVGCGVRFTQTLINRRIPIRSYTGIEVHQPIVDYLRERVGPFDDRFRFIHWDVQNAMYNPGARIRIGDTPSLPVSTSFDLIWLFSVFTHLDEGDAQALLSHIRSVVRPTGSLFFSAFIDPSLDGFEDRIPQSPLENAYFGKGTMERMILNAGWSLRAYYPRDLRHYIQASFVCSPTSGWSGRPPGS